MLQFLILILLTIPCLARDDGRYAQADPALRKWFNEQLIPGGEHRGGSCCSMADGTWAEEDIRDGKYWTRYHAGNGVDSGWVEVPEEALIQKPNQWGRAVVWYWYENGRPKIRCFIAGSLM